MFRNLFKPDSPLMLTMTEIADCIFLSLFCFLGCIPVVTAGASLAALYDAVFRGLRKGEKHSWGRFFETFRRNLRASLLPNLVFLGATGLLSWVMIRLWNAAVAGIVSWMVFSGGALVGVLVAGVLSLLFPMLSRFDNSTGMLLKNTLLLGLAHLPKTLLLGILNTAAVLACLFYVVPLFFLPALAALIGTLLIEPMFKPYLPAEEEAN